MGSPEATVAATALDMMREAAFPYTESVDLLAEVLHRGLLHEATDQMIDNVIRARMHIIPDADPMEEPVVLGRGAIRAILDAALQGDTGDDA